MSDALDAPTIYRTGSPTLGVPVLALGYRSTVLEGLDVESRVRLLEHACMVLDERLTDRERPWYRVRRTGRWLLVQWRTLARAVEHWQDRRRL